MSRPRQPDPITPEHAESFEERIALLFEEIAFAVQWQRPSILLAFCDSETVRGTVELALEKRLAGIGQRLVAFIVDESHFDIPLLLSQHPDRERSVYSVTDLFRGGGKGGVNAYRALNIRREYFVDYAIRLILWLNKDESFELSRHSPDFWAFRHRVVEFPEMPDLERPAEAGSQPRTQRQAFGQSVKQLKQGILLAKQENNLSMLAKYWGKLGRAYQDMDLFPQAIRAYWKAIRQTPEDIDLWNGLGRTYLQQGRMEAARRVLKKAARIDPQEIQTWINLGNAYRIERRLSDAIIAYQRAILVESRNPLANSLLVACYRSLGKHDLAEKQKELVYPILEKETEYHRAVFESACGNMEKARELLSLAIEKKQVGIHEALNDPNLDFRLDDPGFPRLAVMRQDHK
jgi:tetratricopeptide (TPR) repeat protein